MRIRIKLKAKKMPMLYRHRMISFIKEALVRADKDYKEHMYNGRIVKPFSFNLQMPLNVRKGKIQIDERFIIEDNVVDLTEPINLYITSIDYPFIITLLAGLNKMTTFDFSDDNHMLVDNEKITLEIDSVNILKEKNIIGNSAIFKTNSPIFVKFNGKNILFDEDGFEQAINNIINTKLKTIQNRKLIMPLKFEAINMRKTVVKHTLEDFREKTNKPIMYLNCSKGIFKVYGHPIDLEFLYKAGIGNKTGQGFGMVDVL